MSPLLNGIVILLCFAVADRSGVLFLPAGILGCCCCNRPLPYGVILLPSTMMLSSDGCSVWSLVRSKIDIVAPAPFDSVADRCDVLSWPAVIGGGWSLRCWNKSLPNGVVYLPSSMSPSSDRCCIWTLVGYLIVVVAPLEPVADGGCVQFLLAVIFWCYKFHEFRMCELR